MTNTDSRIHIHSNDVSELQFTISNISVAYANALRRTIISDIPMVVFKTTPHEESKCTIFSNGTRLHNEILKQRLECIPVHILNSDPMYNALDEYVMVLDVTNNTDTIMTVSTQDFKIKNVHSGEFLPDAAVHAILPPFVAPTGDEYFIEFVRLHPTISADLPGDKIHLECGFSIGTARQNNAYNATGTMGFGCTPDAIKIKAELLDLEKALEAKDKTPEEIKFELKNWELLDGQRIVVEDSFDFTIKTVGVYRNVALVKMGCDILHQHLEEVIENTNEEKFSISRSDNILDNCYDVVLKDDSYTIGRIISHDIYKTLYEGDKSVNLVGYHKEHPHDRHGTIRISMEGSNITEDTIYTIITASCGRAQTVVNGIKAQFMNV
jgi:DNA-directed RNA polymerase subunit L